MKNLLITILIILFIYIAIINLFAYSQSNDYDIIKSSIDGNNYVVKNSPNKKQSADKLALICANLTHFMNYLKNKYKNNNRINRLVTKFNPNNIRENIDGKYTSYVRDKEDIILCLKTDDINLLMYVVLHELAHIMSTSTHHTSEFHTNFYFLLSEAVNCKIYKYVDYKKTPMHYCGIDVNYTPL